MKRLARIRRSLNKVKKPLGHVRKVKHVRWLLPGWVFYEFYKLHKIKGHSNKDSIKHSAKAEAIRLAAMASLPMPGTYELTTVGLAAIKKKIKEGEIEKFTLEAFKDFTPINKIKADKEILTEGRPYLVVLPKKENLYFKIFYRKK